MSTEGPPSVARHREHLTPGRPHRIYLRLSDDESALVSDAARRVGLTPAGYAAMAVVAAARGGDYTGNLTGELRELQRELFAARRAVNMFGSNVNQAAAAANSTGELPDWASVAVRLCADAVVRLDEVIARIHRSLR